VFTVHGPTLAFERANVFVVGYTSDHITPYGTTRCWVCTHDMEKIHRTAELRFIVLFSVMMGAFAERVVSRFQYVVIILNVLSTFGTQGKLLRHLSKYTIFVFYASASLDW